MKRLLPGVALATMLMLTGCLTGPVGEIDAYRVGRNAAVTYILTGDELSPEKREAVLQLYAQYELLMETIEERDLKHFELLLEQELLTGIEDARLRVLANEALQYYWVRLEERIDFDQLADDQRIKVLREFHRGITEAWADYRTAD